MIDMNALTAILSRVEKPGRYVGGELGRVKKDAETYEIYKNSADFISDRYFQYPG